MAAKQPATKRQKTTDATRTPNASALCPTSKVFPVVEVLENVLSDLSLTDLTRAERVNSLWKNLIRTAPGLQEQRFWKAAPITTLLAWTGENDPEKRPSRIEDWDDPPRLNCNVSTASLGSFDDYEDESGTPPTDKIVSSLHPCLAPSCYSKSAACNPSVACFLVNAKGILSWAPGPWEAMQVTQPPCDKQDLRLNGIDLESGQVSVFDIVLFERYEGEKGVATLGDLRNWMTKVRRSVVSTTVQPLSSENTSSSSDFQNKFKMPPETRRAARLIKATQYRPIVSTRPDRAAAAKVFNIVELLNNILGYITYRELTRLEKVHPVWKENITSSAFLENRFVKARPHHEVVGHYNVRLESSYDPMALNSVFRNSIPENTPLRHLYTICRVHPAFVAHQNDCLLFTIGAEAILAWPKSGH